MVTNWDKIKLLVTMLFGGFIMWTIIMRFDLTFKETIFIGFTFTIYGIVFFLMAYWNKTSTPKFYVVVSYLCMLSIVFFFRLKDLQEISLEFVMWKPLKSLIIILIAYVGGYYISKFGIYKHRILQVVLIATGPILFVLERLMGGVYCGYDWLNSIMPPEILYVSFLFMTILIFTYGGSTKKKIGLLLGYFLIQGVCCVLIHEYGMLLIMAIATVIVVLLNQELRNFIAVFITVEIISGVYVLFHSAKVRTRLLLFMDPLGSLKSESRYVSEQAKIIERFLKNDITWNGSGFELKLSKLPPHLATHYVFQEALVELGIVAVLIILAMFLIVFLQLLFIKTNNDLERKIIDVVVILLSITTVFAIGANFLILPMVGLITPFITLTSSPQANAIYFFLMGFCIHLKNKK